MHTWYILRRVLKILNFNRNARDIIQLCEVSIIYGIFNCVSVILNDVNIVSFIALHQLDNRYYKTNYNLINNNQYSIL